MRTGVVLILSLLRVLCESVAFAVRRVYYIVGCRTLHYGRLGRAGPDRLPRPDRARGVGVADIFVPANLSTACAGRACWTTSPALAVMATSQMNLDVGKAQRTLGGLCGDGVLPRLCLEPAPVLEGPLLSTDIALTAAAAGEGSAMDPRKHY